MKATGGNAVKALRNLCTAEPAPAEPASTQTALTSPHRPGDDSADLTDPRSIIALLLTGKHIVFKWFHMTRLEVAQLVDIKLVHKRQAALKHFIGLVG
jgi:hypothetical protein